MGAGGVSISMEAPSQAVSWHHILFLALDSCRFRGQLAAEVGNIAMAMAKPSRF